MVPHFFITNIPASAELEAGAPTLARGIAFGGDTGLGRIDFSSDGGRPKAPSEPRM
jgi:hypothetical protein